MTSKVFRIGKKTLIQKFMKGDNELETCACSFTQSGQQSDTIENLGKSCDSLASLRHIVLKKKFVSSVSFVSLQRLPPTTSAKKYHSLRSYYQIIIWLEVERTLEASGWEWKSENNMLKPSTRISVENCAL